MLKYPQLLLMQHIACPVHYPEYCPFRECAPEMRPVIYLFILFVYLFIFDMYFICVILNLLSMYKNLILRNKNNHVAKVTHR